MSESITTPNDLNWLGSICDPAASFKSIRQPFSLLTHDGEQWAVGPDGRFMVAVRADSNLPPCPDLDEFLRETLFAAPQFAVPFDSFTRWAADDRADMMFCAKCGGTKKVECSDCHGKKTIECECWYCGDKHEAQCGYCEATGQVPCECDDQYPNPRYGRVNGVIVNRALFGRYISRLPRCETVGIVVTDSYKPILFIGDAWRIVVMPCRSILLSHDESPELIGEVKA